jgi:hypothetical protein
VGRRGTIFLLFKPFFRSFCLNKRKSGNNLELHNFYYEI